MWGDAENLDDATVLEADVCIVGAGAAGISLALRCIDQSCSVLLLEGGDDHRTQPSIDLYEGRCDEPLDDSFMTNSRLRWLGGTTNHWIGACIPISPIIYETRDWIENSGWPIAETTVAAHYEAASEICRVPPPDIPEQPIVPGCDVVRKRSPVQATRFGVEYRPALTSAANVRVITRANLRHIALNREGTAVDHLEIVALLSGQRFDVRARAYVLAMGAIENARMLLVSDDVHGSGVGNDRDLVGRYFQEHAVFPSGEICLVVDRDEFHPFGEKGPWSRNYRLSDAAQHRHRLLSCMFAFSWVPTVADTRRQLLSAGAWRRFSHYLDERDPPLRGLVERGHDELKPDHTVRWRRFGIRPEQVPDPENRVTLLEERDRLGNRRAHLHWRLSEQAIDSARRSVEEFALEVGRRGLGRVRADLRAIRDMAYSPGFHHMGTTRMHPDPSRGVVDTDCKVHGVANLFVASSSVFPASGVANPTFTIVSLAIRLAEHLQQHLEGGRL